MEQKIREIRQSEIDFLLKAFRLTSIPASVFVHGNAATGRTESILDAIKAQNNVHSFGVINCIESGISLKTLITAIVRVFLKSSNDLAPKCDSLGDLVNFIRSQDLQGESVILIFKEAERLRNLPPNVLPVLLKLQELTETNICVVFVSLVPWSMYQMGHGITPTLSLYFEAFSTPQLLTLLNVSLSSQTADVEVQEFWEVYCKYLLDIFGHITRDLRELLHLARSQFDTFLDLVHSEGVQVHEVRKIWKHVHRSLEPMLHGVHLRFVEESPSVVKAKDASEPAGSNLATKGAENLTCVGISNKAGNNRKGLEHRELVELPLHSKYLIVAAYLASHNPPALDKRFFTKGHDKAKRRRPVMTKRKKNFAQETRKWTPRVFPMQRLVAIFYALLDSNQLISYSTAEICMQVNYLVRLGLLVRVSTDTDCISSPKFRCSAALDFVTRLAQTVDVDMKAYLAVEC